jgi:DNA-binding response OmpR family regulator
MSRPTPTILLIEDEDLLRSGVQEVFELHGFQVIGAEDGLEALHWLYETQIDLVVTDLLMPNMNGVELIAKLSRSHPDLPVILVSGAGEQVRQRLGIASLESLGAKANFSKPFKSDELVKKAKELVAFSRSPVSQVE